MTSRMTMICSVIYRNLLVRRVYVAVSSYKLLFTNFVKNRCISPLSLVKQVNSDHVHYEQLTDIYTHSIKCTMYEIWQTVTKVSVYQPMTLSGTVHICMDSYSVFNTKSNDIITNKPVTYTVSATDIVMQPIYQEYGASGGSGHGF